MPDEVDWRFRVLDSIVDRGKQIADRPVDAETAAIFSAWLDDADRVVSLFPGRKGFRGKLSFPAGILNFESSCGVCDG